MALPASHLPTRAGACPSQSISPLSPDGIYANRVPDASADGSTTGLRSCDNLAHGQGTSYSIGRVPPRFPLLTPVQNGAVFFR